MGIEPTLSAWEAEVLPLNYARPVPRDRRTPKNTSAPSGGWHRPLSREATTWKSAPFRVGAIVASPIGAVTAPHSLFPRSFTHCGIARPCGRICRALLRDATLGLPCSVHGAGVRRVPPFCRWSEHQRVGTKQANNRPRTFWSERCGASPTESISLFQLDGIYQRFACANPLTQPSAFPGFRLPGSHDHPHGRSCPVRGLHCRCA